MEELNAKIDNFKEMLDEKNLVIQRLQENQDRIIADLENQNQSRVSDHGRRNAREEPSQNPGALAEMEKEIDALKTQNQFNSSNIDNLQYQIQSQL